MKKFLYIVILNPVIPLVLLVALFGNAIRDSSSWSYVMTLAICFILAMVATGQMIYLLGKSTGSGKLVRALTMLSMIVSFLLVATQILITFAGDIIYTYKPGILFHKEPDVVTSWLTFLILLLAATTIALTAVNVRDALKQSDQDGLG